MQGLQKNLLFNEAGDRDARMRRIVGGNSTHLIELNNIKYAWAVGLYRTMMQNFWIPEEIPLAGDKRDFARLDPAVQAAYTKTLSFLIFLDSLQTANLPNINEYVTAPEVNLCLTVQAFQEAVHSQSYSYILDSVCEPQVRDQTYNFWRSDPHLMARNRLVTDLYEAFIEEPSLPHLLQSVMANYVLEGIYFYSGFSLFYALARQGRMMGTASVIRYIQRDEMTHLTLFQHIYQEILRENPALVTPRLQAEWRTMMQLAVDTEVSWGQYVADGAIMGLSDSVIQDFVRHLANARVAALGWPPLYPEVTESPLPWFEAFSRVNQQKTDFFEQRVLNYTKSVAMDLDSL